MSLLPISIRISTGRSASTSSSNRWPSSATWSRSTTRPLLTAIAVAAAAPAAAVDKKSQWHVNISLVAKTDSRLPFQLSIRKLLLIRANKQNKLLISLLLSTRYITFSELRCFNAFLEALFVSIFWITKPEVKFHFSFI